MQKQKVRTAEHTYTHETNETVNQTTPPNCASPSSIPSLHPSLHPSLLFQSSYGWFTQIRIAQLLLLGQTRVVSNSKYVMGANVTSGEREFSSRKLLRSLKENRQTRRGTRVKHDGHTPAAGTPTGYQKGERALVICWKSAEVGEDPKPPGLGGESRKSK